MSVVTLAALLLILVGAAALALAAWPIPLATARISTDHPLQVGMNTIGIEWLEPESGQPAEMGLPVSAVDFGVVAPGQVLEKDLYLLNRGGQALIIARAYSTCACLTAEISGGIIPPGEVSRVRVRFEAQTRGTDSVTVRRSLVIETNDPVRPQAEVWVQASIGSAH